MKEREKTGKKERRWKRFREGDYEIGNLWWGPHEEKWWGPPKVTPHCGEEEFRTVLSYVAVWAPVKRAAHC